MKILRTANLGPNFTGSYKKKSVCSIVSKRNNILPTRASFFALCAGKIESVQEFKMKPF